MIIIIIYSLLSLLLLVVLLVVSFITIDVHDITLLRIKTDLNSAIYFVFFPYIKFLWLYFYNEFTCTTATICSSFFIEMFALHLCPRHKGPNALIRMYHPHPIILTLAWQHSHTSCQRGKMHGRICKATYNPMGQAQDISPLYGDHICFTCFAAYWFGFDIYMVSWTLYKAWYLNRLYIYKYCCCPVTVSLCAYQCI